MTDNTEDDEHERMRAECSMTYWWPRLQDVSGIMTPHTVGMEVHNHQVEDSSEAEGGFEVKLPDMEEVVEAIHTVGGPPAFLRSDQMSAKHRMARGSKLSSDDPDEIGTNLWTVAEQHHLAWTVPQPTRYYVREWLELDYHFEGWAYDHFAHGTPIATELRFFLHDGEIHGSGFYWPKEAIRRPDTSMWTGPEDDWEALWEETHAGAMLAHDRAEAEAEKVAEVFDADYWSVDFALTAQDESLENPNTWYCIDMARGELSWHPDDVEPPEAVDRGG